MGAGAYSRPVPGMPEEFSPAWVIDQMEKRKRFYLKGFLDEITRQAYPEDPKEQDRLSKQLRARIAWWGRSMPEFARRWEILKEESRLGGSLTDTFPVDEPESLEPWMRDYARCYIKLLNHNKAATRLRAMHGDKVPLYSTIMAMMYPSSPKFVPAFGELMDKCEQWLRGTLEGNVFEALEMAREQNDAKTLASMSLEALSRLDRTKWGKHTQVAVSGTIDHNHQLLQRIQEKAALAAGKVTDMFSDTKALPSGQAVTLDADFKVLDREVVGGASN